MRTSCIRHPDRDPLVFIIRAWQVSYCDGNRCAAALLSFFEYWHNFQLGLQIAEIEADPNAPRTQPLYQQHSQQELSNGILGLYWKTEIKTALKLLVKKGAISIHPSSKPRSNLDEADQYLFHPDKINTWLMERCLNLNEAEKEIPTEENCDVLESDCVL